MNPHVRCSVTYSSQHLEAKEICEIDGWAMSVLC